MSRWDSRQPERAQYQEWEERGNRSLKNRVMRTASQGGGQDRQGVGGGWTPKCVSAGDGWGGRRRSAGSGEDQGEARRGEDYAKRSRFCGCVILLLQAGNSATKPHLASRQGLSSGHHSQL